MLRPNSPSRITTAPGISENIFEVAMVINRADRHTGATHDAFICEACHMWGDIIGNSGAVEIGNVDHGGHGDRAGTHAAVASNAHVDLEAYLFVAEGTQFCAMLNTHDEVACLLFI